MPPKTTRVCSIEECGRPHNARGLCKAHYSRQQRGHTLEAPWKPRGSSSASAKPCGVESCPDQHWAQGYCRIHYRSVMNDPTTRLPLKKRVAHRPGVCAIPECGYSGLIREGMCPAHFKTTSLYGLSAVQYIQLIVAGCAICGSGSRICVDHDHSCCPGKGSCGKCIRGALCFNCNVGLGKFLDNSKTLRDAANYLDCYNGIRTHLMIG